MKTMRISMKNNVFFYNKSFYALSPSNNFGIIDLVPLFLLAVHFFIGLWSPLW